VPTTYTDTIEAEYEWLSAGVMPTEAITRTDVTDEDGTVIEEGQDVFTFPIGISLPLELGVERSGIFEQTFDSLAAISMALRLLVMTNHYERIGNPYYGANLRPLISEYGNLEDFEAQAMGRIQRAVSNFMPIIELDDFSSVLVENDDPALLHLELRIGYSISALGSTQNVLKVHFNLM
tara:strand:- start:382 stop:918 length:537 start_codon:yes stop_codon:yes gene_type:complete